MCNQTWGPSSNFHEPSVEHNIQLKGRPSQIQSHVSKRCSPKALEPACTTTLAITQLGPHIAPAAAGHVGQGLGFTATSSGTTFSSGGLNSPQIGPQKLRHLKECKCVCMCVSHYVQVSEFTAFLKKVFCVDSDGCLYC